MRKILSLILFAALAISFAIPACASDISSMPADQLKQLQREISMQLYPQAEKGTVLFDNEYVKLTYQSIEEGNFGTAINVIVENKTDKRLAVPCDMMTVNNWTVFVNGPGVVAPNSNLKGQIAINEDLSGYGINGLEDITAISLRFYICDTETYDILWTSDMIDLAL